MTDSEDTSLKNEVIQLITCGVCCEFIGTEIFQCAMGHIYCIRCASSLNTCASCRSPMPVNGARTGIRNRALERLLSCYGDLPCLQEGCEVALPFHELEEHYRCCTHRVIKCPCRDCTWTGPISDIKCHIMVGHDEVYQTKSGRIEMRLKNPSGLMTDANAEILLEHEGGYYLVSVWLIRGQRTPSSLTCCLTYMGADSSLTKATLSVESRHYKCKFMCEKQPWTLSDDLQDVRRSTHNLSIDWQSSLRIGEKDPLYRDLDQLRLEPRPVSLDLPITVNISDAAGKYYSDDEDERVPVHIDLVDIEQQEADF